MAQQQSVRSRVNQPERVSLRSDDDTTNTNAPTFSEFQNNLPTPILDAKRCQLIRATIPNAQVSIPNYQLAFWYYRVGAEAAPTAADLYCVRLFPSWYVDPGTLGFVPSINKIYNSPTEFVAALNLAADDDDMTDNPFYSNTDITFSYDATTNTITFQGTEATEYYSPAGWNDPNVIAAMNGTAAKGVIKIDIQGTKVPQKFVPGYTLNLRVGYSMSGQCPGKMSIAAASNWVLANVANEWFAGDIDIPVDSYPNLVYTNGISLLASFITNSSLTSNNYHNLLAVVPVDSVPLGITNYICATSNLLTKLSQTIQTVQIQMLDDAGQPYELPDNAQVSLEVSFSYQDKGF
jgi:hypothetical protein